MTEPWKAAFISFSRSSIDKVQALVLILSMRPDLRQYRRKQPGWEVSRSTECHAM